MPPKKHASLGASGSKRWMACPGSILAIEKAQRGLLDAGATIVKGSVYSREGSAAHELAEWCLLDGGFAACRVGDTLKVVEYVLSVDEAGEDKEEKVVHEVEVTEEMAEAVQTYVDHIRQRDEGTPGKGTHFHEVRFDLAPLNPPGEMFGTADHVVWYPDTKTLFVDDYKHGVGVVVEAVDNPQALTYALGAVVKLRVKPERIVITIVQPRAFHPDGPIRAWEVTWEELVAFKEKLFAAAEETQKDGALLVPGDHCKFCDAAATCPARHSLALEVAQTDFAEVMDEEALPAPGDLTPERLKFILDNAPQVEAWFNAIRAHAEALLNAGVEVPGYKLAPGRANRRWGDEEKAARWLVRRLGKKGAYSKKLLSVAQAEKALKKEGIVLKDALVVKPEAAPRLVPSENPATALPPSAITDFDGI